MSETIQLTNTFVAYGGLAMIFATGVLLFDYVTNRSFAVFISRFGLHLALLVSLGAIFLTLTYSEVFGFVPCGLCWMQRVFMFPQPFLAAAGILWKDRFAARYGMVLAVPGSCIALYQHYLQMGGSELIACPTSGGDCAERIIFAFGFMTFPLLAASLFAFLFVLYWYYLKVTK